MQHIPVHLHDERGLASEEVDDVLTDDLLAAKLDAEPLPAERRPKKRLGVQLSAGQTRPTARRRRQTAWITH